MSVTMNRRTFVSAASAAALVGAMGASAAFATEIDTPAESYDLVVVGMGGAGMCAAIAGCEAGIPAENILIVERNAMAGGNTIFSSSGMNAAWTQYQKERGIEDSVDLFIEETIAGGHGMNQADLVETMCDGSADTIDWLAGHGLVLDNITTTGGFSVKRCHRPSDGSPIGAALVPALEAVVDEDGIQVLFNHRVTDLTKDENGAVNGVVCEDGTKIGAKVVVLATGGFGSNPDMIKQFRPDLDGYVSTNAQSIQGDGMVMAQKAGASLVNMDQIQIHPTVFADGSLVAEGIRGGGAILINNAGDRFTNEMGTRDVVSQAELAQPDGKVWVLYDQTLFDANKVCANYENREMSVKGETLEELCATLGIDAAAVQATLDAYNAAVAAGGEGDPFGRTTGLKEPLETAPFYAIPCSPGIHHCMGGVYVDGDSQALTIRGEKVPGLYAAGEVTGGIHGDNRLGGNAVCDIVVMGINAGQKAAAAAMA